MQKEKIEIKTVKDNGNTYLLNGNLFVPKTDGNKEYEAIKAWITKGNTVEAKFTEAQKKQQAYLGWKANREKEVSDIVVTLDNVSFQGDELAQTRMTRAITSMENDTETIPWAALDNTVYSLTRTQLKQLLRLSGLKQTEIWTKGRPS